MFGRQMSDEWMSDFGNVIGEFRLKKQAAGLDKRQKHSCSIAQNNKSNNSSNILRVVEPQKNIKPSCFAKPNSVSKYSADIIEEHDSDELTLDVLRDFTQKRRVKHTKHDAGLIDSENAVNTTINVTEETKHPDDMLANATEKAMVVACTDDEQGVHVMLKAYSDDVTHDEVTTRDTHSDSDKNDHSTEICASQLSMASDTNGDIKGLTSKKRKKTPVPTDIHKKMNDPPPNTEAKDKTFITHESNEETSSAQNARVDKVTSNDTLGLTLCDTFRQLNVFDNLSHSIEKYQRWSSNAYKSVILIPSTKLFQNALASRHKTKRSICVHQTCPNLVEQTGNKVSPKRNGKSVSDQSLAYNKVSGSKNEQLKGEGTKINPAKVNTGDCSQTVVNIIGNRPCNNENFYTTGLQNGDSNANDKGPSAPSKSCKNIEEIKFKYNDSNSFFSFFLETEE